MCEDSDDVFPFAPSLNVWSSMPFIRNIATVNLNAINSDVKKSLLRDFIWNNDLDIIFIQELSFENFCFLKSHVAIVNISEDRKGTGILVRNSVEFSDIILNCNGRLSSICIDSINYINVYAHSGSNFRKERDKLFTEEILIHLAHGKENVLVGDFNCVLEASDTNGSNNICQGLRQLTSSLDLKDVERCVLKNRVNFTFFRGSSKSRLDRFYGSDNFLTQVQNVTTLPLSFSDHHGVLIKLNVPDMSGISYIGRGYWKLNSFYLKNEDTNNRFASMYAALKTRNSFINLSFWWNNDFKSNTKRFFKTESFNINQQICREKSFYYNCLNELFQKQREGEIVLDEMKIVKSKLMTIEQNKLAFYSHTIKECNILENEKMSLYQATSSLSKSNSSKIISLRADGRITSHAPTLKKIIFDHFSQIFRKQPNTDTDYQNVLRFITKTLTDEERENLVRPIESSELEYVLKNVSKKTSPGPDGLGYEFYTTYFNIVKDEMLAVFNAYLCEGEYPPGLFSSGVITLLPKKGDKHDLNNRRPISMLNTDCKLFTKILWVRLQPLLNGLIGPGQSACLEEQSCINNLRILRNTLLKSKQSRHFKGILLSIDLEKAFDRVDHDFLWATLEQFRFPPIFIDCLKRLYKNANSKVLFNGFLTNGFAINASVRQGCPLSMALFCLYIEPLIRMIYSNVDGCLIGNYFVRIIAYADDINILIRNNHEFDRVLELVNYFSIYAKIRMNLVKSQFLRLNNCRSGPHMIQEVNNLKILGVNLYQSLEQTVEQNYTNLINNLKYAVSLHSRRRLNLLQKVFILNVYILSKLWYVAQIFPPANKHIAEIRRLINRFLWKGYFYTVAKNEVILPTYKGGLALEDVEFKSKSLFIKNILYTKNDSDHQIDEFMMNLASSRNLTRNAREWLAIARNLETNAELNTSKSIYCYLVNETNVTPRIQTDLPNVSWEILFENFSKSFLSSEHKTAIYVMVNDLIPTRSKMYNHRVTGINSPFCNICGRLDTLKHRIKACDSTSVIWCWTKSVIQTQMKIQIDDPEELLTWQIGEKCYRLKAALWLTVEAIKFNLNHVGGTDSDCLTAFKEGIREARWNNKESFAKSFKGFLNVC